LGIFTSFQGDRIEARDLIEAIPPVEVAVAWRRGAPLTPVGQHFVALTRLAVKMPLWSSYLVKVYAWKLLLFKEGAVGWFMRIASARREGLARLRADKAWPILSM
jgi:hypothetical protein